MSAVERWQRWAMLARPFQLPPKDPDWRTWDLTNGRGAGKTRATAEFIASLVDDYPALSVVLIGLNPPVVDAAMQKVVQATTDAPIRSMSFSRRTIEFRSGGQLRGFTPESFRRVHFDIGYPKADLIWIEELSWEEWQHIEQWIDRQKVDGARLIICRHGIAVNDLVDNPANMASA